MSLKYDQNPYYGAGIPDLQATPLSLDVEAVSQLLALCPIAKATPLVSLTDEASRLGVAGLYLKDERERMGLGSFKAVGAAFVIAQQAARAVRDPNDPSAWSEALNGRVFVSSSAGNHGLSIVAAAKLFGAKAVIYLNENVPASFANRLASYGAEVIIEGSDYEASLQAAIKAADTHKWSLLSDSTWPGYDGGIEVMQGYLVIAEEVCAALPMAPTHIFLQAGVGGLAASMAIYLRKTYGESPVIIVVEPEAAPALIHAIRAGNLVQSVGPVSSMGRLDCKIASLSALASLAKTANIFATLTDNDVESALTILKRAGITTSPSGGAGVAASYLACDEHLFGINADSQILCFISEIADG